MHPRVRRLPGGVVVHIADGSVREQPVPPPAPVSRRPSTPDEAVDVLLDAVGTDAPDQCAISMSGGLDSRLLLAALLALGRRPHLIISGTAGSFDREVAVAIGQRLDLPATVVSVTADHVVTTLPSIARMTNGLIPAGNWAGLVHLRSVPDSGLPVLLGFNGELARGYYAPQAGWRIPWVAGSLPRGSNAVLLGRHFGSPFAPGERRWLAPGLQDALAPGQVTRRLSAALDGPALDRAALDRPRRRGAFAAADRLFLEHYGPQKLGNDLAAIDPMVHWRVPMFAVRFVSSVRSLPLAWKLGDRFHRYAISRLCRRLLDSPEEGYGPRTSRRVPMRYWVRGPTQGSTPFFLDHSIFRSERLLGMLGEHREALADLVDPQLIDRLAVEQAQCPSRPQAAFSLLALAMWRDATAADPGSIG